jgi:hypothetical protein
MSLPLHLHAGEHTERVAVVAAVVVLVAVGAVVVVVVGVVAAVVVAVVVVVVVVLTIMLLPQAFSALQRMLIFGILVPMAMDTCKTGALCTLCIL